MIIHQLGYLIDSEMPDFDCFTNSFTGKPGYFITVTYRAECHRMQAAMLFESHFKSSFGNVKEFNLKKLKFYAIRKSFQELFWKCKSI